MASGLARLSRAAAAAVLLLAATSAPGDAQDRKYQVNDSESIHASLREFQRKGGRGEWRAAILELQKVLDVPSSFGAVVRVDGASPTRYEPAWNAALRLFDSMPPAGRTTWEQLGRRPGEELLARGLRLRREEDLAAAARRYPARDIRRRAHDALAHLALARGDFERAARETESLLACTEPEQRAETVARLAFARSRAGDAEATARTALEAGAVLDATVPGPAGPEPLRAFLARAEADVAGSARLAAGARMSSGDSHGSGVSEPPPMPTSEPWDRGTGFRRGNENDDGPSYIDQFRPVAPLIAEGSVYVPTGTAVTALDLATGAPQWRYESPQQTPQWRENPLAQNAAAYSDGTVYAALATRYDAPASGGQRWNTNIIIYSLVHRALHAFDARTGGLIWSHDTDRLAGNPDAAEIERESVASAPLVVGDDVIVVTWTYGMLYQSRLVCFDRRTGATKWRAKLVHGQQEMNLFGRPVKELLAPQPCELDGLVYATTGLGIAAAVDRVTGEIVWLSEYATTDIPPTQLWYQTRDRELTWRLSPVAATRRAVVAAPPESGWLFAFDPRTGAQLWRRPQANRGVSAQWFLGVANDRAYALGSRLFCYDLATGADAWKGDAGRLAPEGVDARPSLGRGLLTGDAVWVPTINGLVRMDARTGAASPATPFPGKSRDNRPRGYGDLFSADGALVVSREFSIECYHVLADLVARLEKRLILAPDDAALRYEAAQVYASSGDLDRAAECLERGLAIVAKLPPAANARLDGDLRRTLVDVLLARAAVRRHGADGPGAWKDLRRAVDAAIDRGDRVRALFALADCAAETHRDEECDAALQRIRTDYGDVVTTVGGEARAEAGAAAGLRLAQRSADRGDLETAIDRWLRLLDERPDASVGEVSVAGAVRTALDACVAKHGDAATRILEARSRTKLEAALAAGDVTALRTLARLSPAHTVAGEAALEAAGRLSAAGRSREAAAALAGAVGRPLPAALLAEALWQLSRVYAELGEPARERAALRRIVQECDGEKLADGREAAEAARTVLAQPRIRDAAATLADPRPPFTQTWEELRGTDDEAPVPAVLQGLRPPALEDAFLFGQGEFLRLIDAATGKDRWRVPTDVDSRAYLGAAGLVVVAGDDRRSAPRMVRLDAFAPDTGRVVWSKRFAGRCATAATALGLVYVLRIETGAQGEKSYRVTSLAADTGEPVAERALSAATTPSLTCAGDAVVVYELLEKGSLPRRSVTTLDGATLAVRGSAEVPGYTSPFSLPVPGTSYVATSASHDGVAVLDTETGGLAWPVFAVRGRAVKALLVAPGSVIVTDTGDDRDHVRRIDAATGRQTWDTDLTALAPEMTLGYFGEAAEGDLVVATMVSKSGSAEALALAIDAATGAVRWRAPIPVEGRILPRPEILKSVVAFELNLPRRTESDCRVAYFGREDGKPLAVIRHEVIGAGRQRVVHQGPWVLLSGLPRADLAVYSGPRGAK